MLDQEIVLALVKQAQNGDEDAKNKLVEENSPLIKSVIRRYLGKGLEYDDLFQLGCLGFVKAIRNFNEDFGVKFSTYVVPMVMGEIKRFMRDDGAVKISRSIKERAATIKIARNALLQELGREPTVHEISERTDFSVEDIATAENATAAVESIQQETGEDGFSLENVLSDTESEDTLLERLALRQGIEQLPDREAMVIRLRYYHGLTQERTSKVLGVSQVQVSRIEKKALIRLKELLG